MSRTLYISRGCPHCKKLLIGIHKYEFLRPMFTFIDVGTQQYPDYIKSVPTLVIDQNMIKADDVFGYLNNMVEQIFEQHPELKQKYHPEQQEPQQLEQHQQLQQQKQFPSENNAPEKPGKGPDYDPVDDLVGWCPDGGCSFADISEQNDDCSKKMVSLQDNMFSPILEENDQMSIQQPQKVPMEQDNSQFQKSAKQQQMDSSYERLMAERNLIK
jgi:hypothetical protein